MMRWTAALLLALSLGCGPPQPVDDGVVVKPSNLKMRLGTVDLVKYPDGRLVDFVNGQDQALVYGVQGGFHIWVLYSVSGVVGRVHYSLLTERLRPDGGRDHVLTLDDFENVPASEPVWQTPNPIRNFMCPTPMGVNVIDQRIAITLSVEDPDTGEHWGDLSDEVVARCPGPDSPDHDVCEKLCSG